MPKFLGACFGFASILLVSSQDAQMNRAASMMLPHGLGEIPLVGLGTGYDDCFYDGYEQKCAGPGADFYDAALGAGCRLFDTAYSYGSEAPLGEALRRWFDRGLRRDEVFIIARPPSTANFCGECRRLAREGVEAESCGFISQCLNIVRNISQAIDVTLARLGLSYVDALVVHHPSEESRRSLLDMWAQMEASVAARKARMLGIVGHPLSWLDSSAPGGMHKGSPLLQAMNLKPTLLFEEYNRMESPSELLPFWLELGIVVYGGGLNRHGDRFADVAAAIAKERSAGGVRTTARQVRLMLMSQTGAAGPGPIVPMTENLDHLQENLAILRMAPLDVREVQRLTGSDEMTQAGRSNDDDGDDNEQCDET